MNAEEFTTEFTKNLVECNTIKQKIYILCFNEMVKLLSQLGWNKCMASYDHNESVTDVTMMLPDGEIVDIDHAQLDIEGGQHKVILLDSNGEKYDISMMNVEELGELVNATYQFVEDYSNWNK
jgi:hypothetical protein